jgi:uncharacterized protein (DUF58 family)
MRAVDVLTLPLHPLHWLAAQVRLRFRAWWLKRAPRSDTLLLTQSNIYIVPTRAGFMFAATLIVLLLASINYQLNLGFLLTFLLAGSGVVSMHVTHATLRGLTLRLRPPAPVHAGDAAPLEIVLTSPGAARYGIGLRVDQATPAAFSWIDVPERSQALTHVSFQPASRGLHAVPTLLAETRFPLGLFRAWTLWRPASSVLVWPAPERPAAVLPAAHASGRGEATSRRAEGSETDGVRAYRRGDPLKLVVWKRAAQAQATGSEDLVSRDTQQAHRQELWLDAQATGLADPEGRLSRLCAWVLMADRLGVDYGLRVAGRTIAPSHGEAHRKHCLEALALC